MKHNTNPQHPPSSLCGGIGEDKMHFSGEKYPKICQKWLIFAMFFFWLGMSKWRQSFWGGHNTHLGAVTHHIPLSSQESTTTDPSIFSHLRETLEDFFLLLFKQQSLKAQNTSFNFDHQKCNKINIGTPAFYEINITTPDLSATNLRTCNNTYRISIFHDQPYDIPGPKSPR